MRGAWRAARPARPGLTLIELLMAIALTGALLAVLMPPLAISEQDLERLVVIVWEAIVEATSERELAAA